MAAIAWCAEVRAAGRSDICVILAERLEVERELLPPLPFAATPDRAGRDPQVDKLSTIRVAPVRHSVPSRLVGDRVEAIPFEGGVRVYGLDGVLVAE